MRLPAPLPSSATSPFRARRRLSLVAVATGVVGTAVLGLSMTSSLAAFTASITNSINTAAAGTVIMQEQNAAGTVTCLSTDGSGNNVTNNTATCSTINKYGGSTTMVPGQTVSTTITIKNTGTATVSGFSLAPSTCTQSGNVTGSATDMCAKLGVVLTQTTAAGVASTITPTGSTLASLATGGALALVAPVAAGATTTYKFDVTLAAAAGNTYQGLAASQPLVWTFTS